MNYVVFTPIKSLPPTDNKEKVRALDRKKSKFSCIYEQKIFLVCSQTEKLYKEKEISPREMIGITFGF